MRNLFVRDRLFSALGFRYFGPFDGHDVETLTQAFARVRALEGPVLMHVVTRKGNGYAPA